MPHLEIRPATADDVGSILALVRGLAEYEKARPEDVSADEGSLRDSLFGAKPAAEVLLGWVDGEAVGMALFFHNYSTWRARQGLYLEDLYVKPHMRGRGFGKALLIELARIARARGCARLEWAVLDWNQPAIDFYKSLGAQPMHEWTVFRLTEEGIARLADGG
jgi:GNAT superfamily N-acetyltransferase